jgi:DNA polymerase-4
MHIDMDAFFASIEQQMNPLLRGKPVIIGGRNNKYRSIICAASYEAKARGIDNAMPSWKALKICPQAIFVPADTTKYIYTSEEIHALLKNYSPQVEKFSIDEFFLDVTGTEKLFGGAHVIGAEIKGIIKKRFGITCSVGVAPTKITAKLAAKLRKPDGLSVMERDELLSVMKNIPVEKICGIGSRLKERFNRLGIRTCGQLAQYPDQILKSHFGVIGLWLKDAVLARSSADVAYFESAWEPPKSVGHSQTLREMTEDEEFIKEWIYLLCEMVAVRLRKKKLQGRTVHFYISDGFGGGFGKQKTFEEPTYDGRHLYRRVLEIIALLRFRRLIARVLAVSVSHLMPADDNYLFEHDAKRERLMHSMDAVNRRFGEWTVYPAALKRAAY